ncbi:GATOR complex protein WDR24 [Taenia crassiceps]|uniref:GATOR2 complex protein WDR24 n=1 Tax=Taenia crassiceps TaxID=6207 RepID=A0ABR4Q6S8_9CEST
MEDDDVKMEAFHETEVAEDGGGGGKTNDLLVMRRRGAMSRKTWFFDAGDPLACVAISSFYPLVAIAGRNLLQVLRVDGDRFISVHRMTNLQRNISSTTTVNTSRSASSAATSTSSSTSTTTATHFQPPRSYAINDVAWSDSKSVLATCSNAGDLIIWDLSRGITQSVCFVGHSRSVHRIHFNPNAPNEIITASHDGTVKLFDVRDQSCRQIFHVRTTAPSPVRDVVYCPREGHTLAAAFENGLACIWDTRNDSRPARCFQAHNAVTASIDWHPMWNSSDRNWFATAGGRDNTIKVWDLNKTSPTTVYSLRTKNTGNIRWRVGETTQLISSCSLSLDLSIHLWELNRPYIPYITFEGHSQTISSIAWSTEPNSFYSVGRDGLLVRHYVGDGLQTVCEANAVALALNCRGSLANALGGEPGQRVLGGKVMKRTASVTTTTRGQHVSLAQRIAPSNVLETTATTTATRTPHQLLVARRHLLPPNAVPLMDDREEAVSLAGSETPANIIPADVFIAQSQSELFVANFLLEKPTEQTAPISSLLLPDTFIYLAKNYRISGSSIEEVCNHNAAVARRVNQDFLSQFWLTLKLFVGHNWQSSPPPTIAKASTRSGTKLGGNDFKRELCLRTAVHQSQQSSRHFTQAEEAGSVCVLDFISRVNAPETDAEREVSTDTTELESGTPKASSTAAVAGSSSTTSGSAVPPPPPAPPHHHHYQQQQPPSSVPETGSLGRSVNFLFADDDSVDHDATSGGGDDLRRSDGTPSRTIPCFSFSSLPAEADAFFEETVPASSLMMVTPAAEQQQQVFNIRKTSLPESNHKSELKSTPEGSATCQGSHETRDTPTLNKRRPCARLNLTSATDCVEAVDPTVVANLTRPLDFTHLVGAWLLELIEAGHVQSVCTALLIFGTERTRINECASEKQIETWFSAYLDVLVRFRLWSVSTRIIKHCGSNQGEVPVSPIAGSSIVNTPTMNVVATPATTTAATPCVAESTQQHLVPKKRSSSLKPVYLALPLARHIAILNQTGTSVSVRCGKCSKPLQRSAASVTTSTSGGGSTSSATPHAAWACGRHPSAETALSTCAVCHMTVRGIYLWCIGCSHGGHPDHIREWITRRAECPAGCGHYCEYGKLDKSLYLQISA